MSTTDQTKPDLAGASVALDRARVATWVLGAVSDLISGVVGFLRASSRPSLEAAWFSGPGSPFAFQHDVRVRAQDDQYLTMFDDGAGPPNVHSQSRGLKLRLDVTRRTATTV